MKQFHECSLSSKYYHIAKSDESYKSQFVEKLFVMPRSSKKGRFHTTEPAESSDYEKDQDESMDDNTQEKIQIDLEARSPIDTDHSAIVYFLEQSFGNAMKKSILDLNQLATHLVTQQSCGSVFYQPLDSMMDDDDDDEPPVLGICSILRFDQQYNKQLQTWLLEKCSENNQAKSILQCKCKSDDFHEREREKKRIGRVGI